MYIAREILEKNYTNHPDGNIHIIKHGAGLQYYIRNNSNETNGTYVSRKEKEKIKKYLQKRYDIKTYSLINKEINALESMLISVDDTAYGIQEVFSNNHPEVKSLVHPIAISDEDYVKQWSSIPYEKKMISENQSVQITEKGELVRSKSELNIANKLHKMNIPYKYECPLVLNGGITIYPDFTILDVKQRREVYWEHRGMMDDREYVRDSVMRIKEYMKSDIILGDRLIITEETSLKPLGTFEIEKIIRHYFLTS